MKKHYVCVNLIITLVAISGCKTESALIERCPFVYDKKAIDDIVIPTLKSSYGQNWNIFDVNHPSIIIEGDEIELSFMQTRIDVLDTPNFVIRLDSCSQRIIKSYETSPFPSK